VRVTHADCDLGAVDASLVQLAFVAGFVPSCARSITQLEETLVHASDNKCLRAPDHGNTRAIVEPQLWYRCVCVFLSACCPHCIDRALF
jgi:hypothetical protein